MIGLKEIDLSTIFISGVRISGKFLKLIETRVI